MGTFGTLAPEPFQTLEFAVDDLDLLEDFFPFGLEDDDFVFDDFNLNRNLLYFVIVEFLNLFLVHIVVLQHIDRYELFLLLFAQNEVAQRIPYLIKLFSRLEVVLPCFMTLFILKVEFLDAFFKFVLGELQGIVVVKILLSLKFQPVILI